MIYMCNLRRKLITFDYVIGRLVEWDHQNSGRTELQSLQMFSNARLMKCLYSILISSDVYRDEFEIIYSRLNKEVFETDKTQALQYLIHYSFADRLSFPR